MSTFSKFMKLFSMAGGVRSKRDPVTGGIRKLEASGRDALADIASVKPGVRLPAIETFRDLNDWTIAQTGANSRAEYTDGKLSAKAIRFTTDLVAGSNTQLTQDQKIDLSAKAGFWVFSRVNYRQTASPVGLTSYLAHAVNLGGGSGRWTSTGLIPPGAVSEQAIWFPKSSWSVLDGSPNFSNPVLSWRFRADSGVTEIHDYALLGIMTSSPQRPSVVIGFDDGWSSSLSVGHVEARKREIPLTHYLIAGLLGSAGYITAAEATAMKASGDYIGLHGASRWDTDLPKLRSDHADLLATGLSDCVHAAYPEGQIGYGYDWKNTTAVLGSLGVKTARLAGVQSPNLIGYGDPLALCSYPLNNTLSLAQAKAAVDTAISARGSVHFYPHKLGAVADSLTWTTSDYIELLDYIAGFRDSGTLDALTIEQWFDGVLP